MSQSSQSSQPSQGPPYPPTTAGLGGSPTVSTDIPVSAVFIFLYICFAVTNMSIFQINRRRGHKFFLSALLFGFCMARIATLVLRIAWANRQHNIRLAIAAQIFVNAGILVLYIVNFILAQRVLRAKQPHIGWNPVLRLVSKIMYFAIGAALIMVIISVVLSLYTLNEHTRLQCRDVQLTAITYLLIFTCLPLVHIIVAIVLPRSKDEESFGEGSMRSKVILVTISTCLCIIIAGFKSGTTWSPARPITRPAWYDSKAAFYIFNFTLEILALCVLTISRIDKRFFVPNGCKQAGDYTQRKESKAREVNSAMGLHEKEPERKTSVKMYNGSPREITPEPSMDDKV